VSTDIGQLFTLRTEVANRYTAAYAQAGVVELYWILRAAQTHYGLMNALSQAFTRDVMSNSLMIPRSEYFLARPHRPVWYSCTNQSTFSHVNVREWRTWLGCLEELGLDWWYSRCSRCCRWFLIPNPSRRCHLDSSPRYSGCDQLVRPECT
jgi:hypothetical protein